MLLPHQWAVLTVEEAKALKVFIEKSTATKREKIYLKKIKDQNIFELWNKLREFIENYEQYEYILRHLDTSEFAPEDHEHHRSRPED